MKRIALHITLLLALACSLAGTARTIRDFFASEPDDVLLTLSRNSRLDMLDYWDSGQKVQQSTRLTTETGGATLTAVTDNFISLSTSGASTVEMMLVPASKSDTIIAVTQNYLIPEESGTISFYDTKWRAIPREKVLRNLPTIADFAAQGTTKDDIAQIQQLLPFYALSYHMNATDGTVTVRHNIAKMLTTSTESSTDKQELVQKMLLDSITYQFKGKRLQRKQ